MIGFAFFRDAFVFLHSVLARKRIYWFFIIDYSGLIQVWEEFQNKLIINSIQTIPDAMAKI